jgi:ABC-2 type transport system permease protein
MAQASSPAGQEHPMTTAVLATRPPHRRHRLRLVVHQIGYEQLSFWRNPQAAIFTFVFPVLFVTIMGALFGSVGRSSYFGGLSPLQYYVPTIAALCVLGSCYGQLAVALAARRQNGILKRLRATPLPAWAYFIGLLVHCVLVSLADAACQRRLRPAVLHRRARRLGRGRRQGLP